MINVKYRERTYLDKYRAVDQTKVERFAKFQKCGGLYYFFDASGYVVRVIEEDFIEVIDF